MNDDLIARRAAMLQELYARAPMKRTFGMTLSFDAAGDATFQMPNHPGMHHTMGDTHGGVIATILDNAGWFTAATRYDCWINTSELTVRLHEPAKQADLIGTGSVIRAGRRICVAQMAVHSQCGRLVATGSGCFVVSTVPFQMPRPDGAPPAS